MLAGVMLRGLLEWVTKSFVFQGCTLETVFRALSLPLLSIKPISAYLHLDTFDGLSRAGWGTE